MGKCLTVKDLEDKLNGVKLDQWEDKNYLPTKSKILALQEPVFKIEGEDDNELVDNADLDFKVKIYVDKTGASNNSKLTFTKVKMDDQWYTIQNSQPIDLNQSITDPIPIDTNYITAPYNAQIQELDGQITSENGTNGKISISINDSNFLTDKSFSGNSTTITANELPSEGRDSIDEVRVIVSEEQAGGWLPLRIIFNQFEGIRDMLGGGSNTYIHRPGDVLDSNKDITEYYDSSNVYSTAYRLHNPNLGGDVLFSIGLNTIGTSKNIVYILQLISFKIIYDVTEDDVYTLPDPKKYMITLSRANNFQYELELTIPTIQLHTTRPAKVTTTPFIEMEFDASKYLAPNLNLKTHITRSGIFSGYKMNVYYDFNVYNSECDRFNRDKAIQVVDLWDMEANKYNSYIDAATEEETLYSVLITVEILYNSNMSTDIVVDLDSISVKGEEIGSYALTSSGPCEGTWNASPCIFYNFHADVLDHSFDNPIEIECSLNVGYQ